jgi:hypothetical protein
MKPYQSLLVQLRREEWPFESLEVVDPDRGLNQVMAMRIGMGRIIKIKEAAKNSIASALGLIYYSATVQVHGGLLLFGYLALGWPVVGTLTKAIETISDPDELQVFEAVATLAAEICVVDSEALKKEDFPAAYGKRAPFREDIVMKLSGKVSSHVIDKSLAALKQRGILVCDDERWRIAF